MKNYFEIKVVIGSWKAYNECNERALGSKWLDVGDFESLEELKEELKLEGFTSEELEETFLQDYESDLNCELFNNCDYISIEKLREVVEILENIESYDVEKVKAICEAYGIEEALEVIENDELEDFSLYEDCEDASDYAREMYQEGAFGEISNRFLENYIDFEAIGRDMVINSEIEETSFGVLAVYR